MHYSPLKVSVGSCFATLASLHQLPQDSQEGGCQVEDVMNFFKEMTDDELLDLIQDPNTHKLVNTIMKMNPTQYMLELEKEGDKLPSTFDVSTIIEKPLGTIPHTSFKP